METTFVIVSYVLTFGGIGVLVAGLMHRARRLAAGTRPEDRPWS